MSEHKKLVLALALGVIFGLMLHPFSGTESLVWINAHILQPIGQIFLRSIFMVVVPLIFSALVLATCELSQGQNMGKVAQKTLMYTIIISSFSVLIGVSMVNIIKPGQNYSVSESQKLALAEQSSKVASIAKSAEQSTSFSQTIVELIPKNPLASAAKALDGEMIAVMVFALIFGVALSVVQKKQKEQLVIIPLLDQVFNASMEILHFSMKIAPYAVFALVFNTVFVAGYKILLSLFLYVFTVVLALLIQQLVVYSSALKIIAKKNPWAFFKACQDVYLYAFSTSSSNATLPKALETAEQNLKLKPEISRFVLTVGATANQNGTAIFEGITVLFLAQVYQVDLSLAQQVQVVLFSILAGVGTAGVPGGSLPLIMILQQSVGIPAEGIGLILGVDRFLDMCRTTINVSGDLVIAALVSNEKQ